ncbi:unnamed protein product [Owenia fusiformis]|uniref:Histidine N-acetyltransferase C-terminal domain-containing protein n=1 Tax=Owenia fusiformis TaxID=6347 RepID=A0A8J1UDX0_OWEFU|nr:unnamed protein product [Owenia fusiformis]
MVNERPDQKSEFTVLDGGRTGVRQAARTAAQHRGKGFYKILENYSTMQINFLCPNLEQWAYTAYWNTFEKKRISNPELGYQLIDKRYWKVYIIKETDVYLNTVHPGNNGLPTQTEPMHEINIDEAEGILKDPDNKERLVPSGSLCSSWEPFSVDDGLRTNLTAIYTRSSVWGTKIDGDCRALSTGTIYECPKGLMYDLDYYGQEFKQLKAHILSHVKHALKESNMNRQLYLCVFCPFEMSLADLDEFMLKDMGWKPEPTDETPVYVTITKRL